MKVDLDKLEALAKAATPGEWREGAMEKHSVFVPNRHPEALGPERVLLRMNVHWPHEDDTKYIAAASPDVVLALIAELRAIRPKAAALDMLIDDHRRETAHRAAISSGGQHVGHTSNTFTGANVSVMLGFARVLRDAGITDLTKERADG